MQLNAQEKAWLAGEAGPATQRAMEITAALGKIYGAAKLIPVTSVQISGVSYRNIGAAGLDFLRRWADEGAQVRVPTMLNPAAMDMEDWRAQGFSPDFAAKQAEVVAIFARMGVSEGHPTPTCTPYLIGNTPATGEHVAWAESSAISYANSVLGARSNREGGPGAIAAAISGRTGAYGLHLTENRRANVKVMLRTTLQTPADYSALGACVGQAVRKAIPYFENLPLTNTDPLWREKLKALGAAMAASGAVALYHVAGLTPEAQTPAILAAQHRTLEITDIQPGYAGLNDASECVDLVWIGCPHASLAEIARVAEHLHGKRLRVPLWVTCARPIKEAALAQGIGNDIITAGGRLIADACIAIAPVRDLGFNCVATSSAKGAFYLRNLAGVAAHFGNLTRCVNAALSGTWEKEG